MTFPELAAASDAIPLPPAVALLARDRRAIVALAFLVFATALFAGAVFVGFDLYMNTDLSSAASIGIMAVPALVIWVVALVLGSLVPISRLNRARCDILRERTGATDVWSLTETASIDDFIAATSPDGVAPSLTFQKTLLAINSETFSIWVMHKHQLGRVLTLPTSALTGASVQADPGSGSPLAMKVCLTVRIPDGSIVTAQFNPAPTTMHLLTEAQTAAAVLQTYVQRSRKSETR